MASELMKVKMVAGITNSENDVLTSKWTHLYNT
mgnify:CR=1 FL=1